MKIRILHPLWTHLTAAAALIAMIVFLVLAGPLPARVPIHFGLNGQPNNYGSPWSAFGLFIGLSVFFILLSIFLDELWARQEKAKSFNWLSLLDEIVVGFMAGINIGYLSYIRQGTGTFEFPWSYLGLAAGGSIIVAILLEMARPYRPYDQKLVIRESSTLKQDLARQLKDNSSFFYWEYQNPFYVRLLTIVLPLIMLAVAVWTWFSEPWASVIVLVAALALIIPYGGLRVLVTRQYVTVRFGIFGIRVLRLKMAEISGVEVHQFSPLRDFGGYGIRFNKEIAAYYMNGTRGVKLTNIRNKKYLIGSDDPERLAAIISTLTSARS